MRKKKSRFFAASLSLFFPGLGQFYNGSWVKGLLMLAGCGASVYMLMRPLLPMVDVIKQRIFDLDGFYEFVLSGGLEQMNVSIDMQSMISNFAIWSIVFFIIYLYSFIDAIIVANRINTEIQRQREEAFERELIAMAQNKQNSGEGGSE